MAVAIALLLLYVAVAEAVQAFAGGEARLSHVASAAVRDALIAGGGHRKGAYAALTKESDAPPRRASTLPSPARSEFRRLLKVALDVKRAYPFLRNAQYLKDGSRLLRVAALVTEAAANLTHAPPGGAAAPPRGRPDAAGPPQRVRAFEVGGGFGLLAMAAARGGVAAVVVEPEAAARALAAAVVRRSGLAGRVAVVGGWGAVGAQAHALCWALLYPALPLPVAHAPTRALVRGVMPAVREAARRLAPACAAVRWLPAEIRVWAQVVEFRGPKSTTLAPFHIRNASGFDVSLLNAHRRHLPAHADLSTGGTARLSPPFVVAVLEPPALPRLAGSAALTLDPWEGPWDVGLAIWSEAAGEGPRASGPGRRFARQEVHLFDVGGDCAARPRRPVRAVVTWQPAAWAGGLEFAMAAGACRWRPLPRRAGPSGPARWHVPMLLDWRRNAFYDEGMRRQLRDAACAPSGCRVLDIGAGSGLLGMMLYRAGARHVAFIERDRETALAAYRIVRANFPRAVVAWGNATDAVGLVAGSRSQGPDFVMLHMDSAELLLPPELRFDVLISEIFDTALFGEGVLKTVRQARDRLLVPGARIFPPRADLLAQVWAVAGGASGQCRAA